MVVEELVAALGVEVDTATLGRFSAAFGAFQTGFAGAVAGIVGAFAGVAAIAYSTAKAGDDVVKTADRLSMATDSLQELRYAAKLSGADSESLTAALAHLGRAAAEAHEKGGEAARAFRGIKLTEDSGQIRSIEALFTDVAEKIRGTASAADRLKLSQDLLSRQGRALIPLMDEGAEGIAKLRAEARSLGVVLGKDALDASVRFSDAADRATAALTGWRNRLATPLLEKFVQLLDNMTKRIAANGGVFALVAKGIGGLIDGINWLLEHDSALRGLILAVTIGLTAWGLSALAAAGATATLSIASIAAAAASAAAWALAALPFVALASFIVLLGEDLYSFATGGKSAIGELLKWFDKFSPDDSPLMKLLRAAGSLLFDLTDTAKWKKLGDAIVEAFAPLGILKQVASFFQEQDDTQTISQKFPGLADPFNSGGMGFVDSARDKFPGLRGVLGEGERQSFDVTSPRVLAPPVLSSQPRVSRVENSTTIAPVVQVTAQTNASPEQIASAASAAVSEVLDTHMREASAQTGGYSR